MTSLSNVCTASLKSIFVSWQEFLGNSQDFTLEGVRYVSFRKGHSNQGTLIGMEGCSTVGHVCHLPVRSCKFGLYILT